MQLLSIILYVKTSATLFNPIMGLVSCLLRHRHNKAFKTDSQRMAFFIPSLGLVFTVVWLSLVVALLTT
ncbi:hypothetical protein DMW38_23910 [Vibrio parahaemolyticus]|nr:hypothetical protein [Vibrio parahaemolyticus]